MLAHDKRGVASKVCGGKRMLRLESYATPLYKVEFSERACVRDCT